MKRLLQNGLMLLFFILPGLFINAQERVNKAKNQKTFKVENFIPQEFNRVLKKSSGSLTEEIKGIKSLKGEQSELKRNKNAEILTRNKLKGSKSESLLKNTAQPAGWNPVFYEGFENWTGNINWLPQGWIKSGTHPNDNGKPYNWFITTQWENAEPIDPASKYIAWVNGDTYNMRGTEIGITGSDEWLITPEFTVGKDNYLTFDLHFDPYYLYYNGTKKESVWDINNPVLDFIVNISLDGGNTWTPVFGLLEYYAHYDGLDFLYTTDFSRYRVGLNDYNGKKIKLGFRYICPTGGGNSLGLDEVYVGEYFNDPVIARYYLPKGYYQAFPLGHNQQGLFYPTDYNLIFENASENADSFTWFYRKDDGSMGTSNNYVLLLNYQKPVIVEAPILRACNQYGCADAQYPYPLLFGGNSFVSNFEEDAKYHSSHPSGEGTADENGKGDALYGYNKVLKPVRFIEIYDKPLRPFVMNEAIIGLQKVSGNPNTEITLKIRKMLDQENRQLDLANDPVLGIAKTKYGTSENPNEASFLYFEWDNFVKIDGAFYLEVSGFPQDGSHLFGLLKEDANDDMNTFFFTLPQDIINQLNYESGSNYTVNSCLRSNQYNTSGIVIPEIIYPFIALTSHPYESYDVPTDGGYINITMNSMLNFGSTGGVFSNDTWLNVSDVTFNDETFDISFKVTAAENKSSGRRTGTIDIVDFSGYRKTLTFYQGVFTDIENINKIGAPYAVMEGNHFVLNYDPQFTSVELYNASGQNIMQTNLPESGNFSIPVSHLSKGVYLLKFKGSGDSRIVKLIK